MTLGMASVKDEGTFAFQSPLRRFIAGGMVTLLYESTSAMNRRKDETIVGRGFCQRRSFRYSLIAVIIRARAPMNIRSFCQDFRMLVVSVTVSVSVRVVSVI